MRCPDCGGTNTYIRDSRRTEEGQQRRRRECVDCEVMFDTYEVSDLLSVREPGTVDRKTVPVFATVVRGGKIQSGL